MTDRGVNVRRPASAPGHEPGADAGRARSPVAGHGTVTTSPPLRVPIRIQVWMSMLFGVVFLSHQLGSFSGLWLAGYLYDLTKSYDAMWWVSIALGLCAGLIHWPIKERPVARLLQPSPA